MTSETTSDDIARAKDALRQQVWDLLEYAGAVAPGVHGYIPDFTGAGQAAHDLAHHPAWTAARVVMATPDRAQLPVRARALADGKLVYMAVPKLAADPPFILLDPAILRLPPEEAAAHQTATQIGRPVRLDQMIHIDLVICGSVAVNLTGVRLGKGGGYFDREIALLRRGGLIDLTTVIATTVHPFQVRPDPLPTEAHDVNVDIIVSSDGTGNI